MLCYCHIANKNIIIVFCLLYFSSFLEFKLAKSQIFHPPTQAPLEQNSKRDNDDGDIHSIIQLSFHVEAV